MENLSMKKFLFVALAIMTTNGIAFSQTAQNGISVQINRSDSAVEKPVPIEWKITDSGDFQFSVQTPVSYELQLTTLRGEALKNYHGIAHEGWQSFDLAANAQSGACILRIKIGSQLVVLGKLAWPNGKV